MTGGGLGVLSRYGFEQAVPSPSGWPLATLLINLAGAWALGALLEGLHRRGPDVGIRRSLRLLLGTGFLGGFTTYSALALESVLLLALENSPSAALYLALSLFGGALASWAGIWCGAAFDRRTLARSAASER
ncbi:CrcB family protein [Arthrobacter sp. SO5]|uniref:fluoride efflux transporter FluC n=1 Tax=Arthrobacter sp. SO5 TaxID=1897055 RepID=UPI001E4A2EA9|nr:CrcB family protein [Arthrobacter sp. SO5]